MRLKIVINREAARGGHPVPARPRIPVRALAAAWSHKDAADLARTAARAGVSAWDEASGLLVAAARGVRRTICGLTGHDDSLKLQRQRLSLCCTRCGRTTAGWDLTDPTPPVPPSHRPRFLELVRRRS